MMRYKHALCRLNRRLSDYALEQKKSTMDFYDFCFMTNGSAFEYCVRKYPADVLRTMRKDYDIERVVEMAIMKNRYWMITEATKRFDDLPIDTEFAPIFHGAFVNTPGAEVECRDSQADSGYFWEIKMCNFRAGTYESDWCSNYLLDVLLAYEIWDAQWLHELRQHLLDCGRQFDPDHAFRIAVQPRNWPHLRSCLSEISHKHYYMIFSQLTDPAVAGPFWQMICAHPLRDQIGGELVCQNVDIVRRVIAGCGYGPHYVAMPDNYDSDKRREELWPLNTYQSPTEMRQRTTTIRTIGKALCLRMLTSRKTVLRCRVVQESMRDCHF